MSPFGASSERSDCVTKGGYTVKAFVLLIDLIATEVRRRPAVPVTLVR